MESINDQLAKSEIESRIYSIRGVQVMIDSDLAVMYSVETKQINRAVKRNEERFPQKFMFQLSESEWKILQYQNGTSSTDESLRCQIGTLKSEDILRSQNVTLKQTQGKHRKYLPYVFTEQGVAMLSAVLRSETAVKVSLLIMDAFVEMRKLLISNAGLLQRVERIETKLIVSDANFEKIFNAMQSKDVKKENIFFAGQIYDAYSFVVQLIEKANTEIILIDNYVDNTVLDMISKKKKGVSASIYTHQGTKLTDNDVTKFNKQYPTLSLKHTSMMHDRFLLIDKCELYHIGASLKDLGNKCFAFSLIEDKAIITNLLKNL